MYLPQYCLELAKRLLKDECTARPEASEEELIKQIRAIINRHHVTTNVLITFSAAFLLHTITKKKNIPRPLLDKILIQDDQIIKSDVTSSLKRLTDNGILWGDDEKGYIAPKNFLTKLPSG